MLEFIEPRERPFLKELVQEASRALALLDADRLEELANSCQALNRDLPRRNPAERARLAGGLHDAAGELATFAGVLQATRANLVVMYRLQQLRQRHLEYSENQVRGGARTGSAHGID